MDTQKDNIIIERTDDNDEVEMKTIEKNKELIIEHNETDDEYNKTYAEHNKTDGEHNETDDEYNKTDAEHNETDGEQNETDGEQNELGNTDGQKILETLDNSKFSLFHVMAILIAGMGFFSDAYDLFVISLLTKLIGRIYYPDIQYYSPAHCLSIGNNDSHCGTKYYHLEEYLANQTLNNQSTWNNTLYYVPSAMPSNVDSAIKGVALIGTLLGQIVFGYLGDRYGRKKIYGITLGIMIVAAICSGLSFGQESVGVIVTLCIFRFFLGFGIGGDYPLSATIMSEYSSKNRRGQYVAAVFAQQGTGILCAGIVSLSISAAFRGRPDLGDYVWRIILILGALPAALTMYFRLSMPETARFTLHVEKDAKKTAKNMDSVMKTTELSQNLKENDVYDKELTWRLFFKKFGWKLFGCASAWLLLDIAYYSSNLFQPDVFSKSGLLPAAYTMTGIDEVFNISKAQLIIALVSTIPGYWMTVLTIEKLGRIKIQVMGFIMMTLFMGLLAGLYRILVNDHIYAFIALYALCFFFSNWGPNSTTFIIPSELFPTAYRSTGHGISAASGKLGAVIGAFGFGAIQQAFGLQTCIICLTVVNFFGLLCTFPIPETTGISLEELAGETSVEESPDEPWYHRYYIKKPINTKKDLPC